MTSESLDVGHGEPFPHEADRGRYRWLTEHPYIAERESRILGHVPLGDGPLLEIGSGEGANLHHLMKRLSEHAAFGLDSSAAKLHVGRSRMSRVLWLAGDALSLPIQDGQFGAVLLRDLLHHVPSRMGALREAARVLAAGGRLSILEANGEALFAWVFSRLIPHERGLRESRFERVEAQVAAVPDLVVEQARLIEPAAVYRLLFHYRYGLPGLARWKLVVRCSEVLEQMWTRLGSKGTYILVVARKVNAGVQPS